MISVTKREILVSIGILAILITLGFLIGNKISDVHREHQETYNKATKIETQNLFEYGMETNLGNAFVYGDLKAVDTVTYPYLKGEYMWVEKVTQRLTAHVHTTTDSKGNTRSYTTWDWDNVYSESKHSSKLSFLNNEFDFDKIEIPGSEFFGTEYVTGMLRNKYYVVDKEHTGTLYTTLKDNTISEHSKFYKDRDISETKEGLDVNVWFIVFWVVWSMFIAAVIVVFVILENKWLYEKNK